MELETCKSYIQRTHKKILGHSFNSGISKLWSPGNPDFTFAACVVGAGVLVCVSVIPWTGLFCLVACVLIGPRLPRWGWWPALLAVGWQLGGSRAPLHGRSLLLCTVCKQAPLSASVQLWKATSTHYFVLYHQRHHVT